MRELVTLLRTPATAVCAVLVALTVASLVLGGGALGAGANGPGSPVAGALILVVAMVKVALVGSWFMELREAPRGLRLAFHGWCVGVGALLTVLYLVG